MRSGLQLLDVVVDRGMQFFCIGAMGAPAENEVTAHSVLLVGLRCRSALCLGHAAIETWRRRELDAHRSTTALEHSLHRYGARAYFCERSD